VGRGVNREKMIRRSPKICTRAASKSEPKMNIKAFIILGMLSSSALLVGCSAAGESAGTEPDGLDTAGQQAGEESVKSQAEAVTSCPQPWYRAAIYPAGQSCTYACYYSVKAGTYAQCKCTVREPGSVEMWVNNCPK
jgi:hypothetical protein